MAYLQSIFFFESAVILTRSCYFSYINNNVFLANTLVDRKKSEQSSKKCFALAICFSHNIQAKKIALYRALA